MNKSRLISSGRLAALKDPREMLLCVAAAVLDATVKIMSDETIANAELNDAIAFCEYAEFVKHKIERRIQEERA